VKSHPGTYALVLSTSREETLAVGKLGLFLLLAGFYVYVGSAFGPGGIRARVAHHRQSSCRLHWHIDYLRPYTRLKEVWFTYDSVRREHHWAEALAQGLGGLTLLSGFGASDCRCKTHLYYFRSPPSAFSFCHVIYAGCDGHGKIHCERVNY
jgi:Uri superfamily endonuclease